jgi:hypothetical protein
MRFAAAMGALIVALAIAAPVPAAEPTDAATEQELALRQADREVLEAQRSRFRAIFFAKDPADRKRAEQRFKDVQKKRRQLLQASGQ